MRTGLKRFGMVIVAAAATAGSMVLIGPGTASAATPFTCEGQVFLGQNAGNSAQFYEGTFGQGEVDFSLIGSNPTIGYNAIGFNTEDNYVYGIRGDNNALVQIGSDGVAVGLGQVGLPAGAGFNAGAFDDSGNLYVMEGNTGTTIYVIDVSSRTVTDRIDLSGQPVISDFVFKDGYLWGGTNFGTSIVRINPSTGSVDVFPNAISTASGDPFGGVFLFGNGDLGFYENSGTLHRVAVTNSGAPVPAFEVVSTQSGPFASNSDATSCVAQPTDLGIVKVGSPDPVQVGGTVTYTLTVTNHGPGGSSGYSVSDVLPAGLSNVQSGTPGCTVAGNDLSCTGGALAVGESAQITVTATAGGPVGEVMNSATVRGNEEDPNPDNNTADETVEIVDVPLLAAGIALGGFGAVGAGFGLRRHRARRKVVG
ncbi:DUF11 domain-containing protein [Saccharomonospora sp. NPDC046836]|uniref:DUF11 domain-containing protein n=1 Tax=Saccharomonospora sp. NPDC046836 TaxID=3156921 RepID=UPI0033D2FDAB